ncbi:hypothetical protein KJ830_04320 [bacterium]|nr:hypothetical protein [bacterium]
MEGWIPIFMGMTYGKLGLPRFLRKLAMTEGWIPASAGMTEGKIFVAIEREVG